MSSGIGLNSIVLLVVCAGFTLGLIISLIFSYQVLKARRRRCPGWGMVTPCPLWDAYELEQRGYQVVDVYDDKTPIRSIHGLTTRERPSPRYVSRTVKVRHNSSGHIMLVRMAWPLR